MSVADEDQQWERRNLGKFSIKPSCVLLDQILLHVNTQSKPQDLFSHSSSSHEASFAPTRKRKSGIIISDEEEHIRHPNSLTTRIGFRREVDSLIPAEVKKAQEQVETEKPIPSLKTDADTESNLAISCTFKNILKNSLNPIKEPLKTKGTASIRTVEKSMSGGLDCVPRSSKGISVKNEIACQNHRSSFYPYPYVCSVCNKCFKRRAIMHKHMLKAHGKASEERPEVNKKIDCATPSFTFSSNDPSGSHASDNPSPTASKSNHVVKNPAIFSGGKSRRNRGLDVKSSNKSVHDTKDDVSIAVTSMSRILTRSNGVAIYNYKENGMKCFTCPTCKKNFKWKYNLKRHMLTHDSEPKRFLCRLCSQGFSFPRHLNAHMKKQHTHMNKSEQWKAGQGKRGDCGNPPNILSSNDTSGSCLSDNCPPIASRKIQMLKNPFFVSGRKSLRNQGLDIESPNNSVSSMKNGGSIASVNSVSGIITRGEGIVIPIYKENKTKCFSCPKCEKRFKLKHHLKEHMWTHSESKQFSCEFCSQGFNFPRHLKVHREKHHQHMSESEKWKVGQGNRGDRGIPSHTLSLNDTSGPSPSDTCSPTVSQKHRGVKSPAHLCRGKSLRNRDFDMNHQNNSVHSMKNDGSASANWKSRIVTRGKGIVISIYNENKVKCFTCPTCEKRCKSKQALKEHMWTHSESKRFPCELCSQGFNFPCQLKAHMKIQHKNMNKSEQWKVGQGSDVDSLSQKGISKVNIGRCASKRQLLTREAIHSALMSDKSPRRRMYGRCSSVATERNTSKRGPSRRLTCPDEPAGRAACHGPPKPRRSGHPPARPGLGRAHTDGRGARGASPGQARRDEDPGPRNKGPGRGAVPLLAGLRVLLQRDPYLDSLSRILLQRDP